MLSTHFAFWVQGYFEISQNKIRGLNPQQVIIIKKHLELVYAVEKEPSKLVAWFKQFIDDAEKLSNNNSLSPKATEIIRARLSQEFEHVIDPIFGDSSFQQSLNQIHNPNSDVLVRR